MGGWDKGWGLGKKGRYKGRVEGVLADGVIQSWCVLVQPQG
jgi:hypothetical protein